MEKQWVESNDPAMDHMVPGRLVGMDCDKVTVLTSEGVVQEFRLPNDTLVIQWIMTGWLFRPVVIRRARLVDWSTGRAFWHNTLSFS